MATDTVFPSPLWARVALSALLVFHVAAGFANITKDSWVGSVVRDVTQPWEKLLGVHQTWPMFVVAPRTTSWLTVTGIHADGTELSLHPLDGEPLPNNVVWFYSRLGKLERNAVATKREYLRTSIVRSECAANPELRKVRFERVSQPSPPAWSYRTKGREHWPTRRDPLQQWNCKR